MEEQVALLAKTIKPLNRRVIVVRDIEKENPLVYVQEKDRERFNSGEVIAMAPDCESGVQVGNRVSFQKWGGVNQEAVLPDGKVLGFVSLREEELTMVVEGGAFVREERKEGV